MTVRHGERALQLSLWDTPAQLQQCVDEWTRHEQLWSDLHELERGARAGGFAGSTSKTLKGTVAGMLRDIGAASLVELFADRELAVDAIHVPARRRTRLDRLRALHDCARLLADGLPPNVKSWMREIEGGFAGRVRPRDHLLDIEVGGSRKAVRPPVPFGWLDGERLVAAASGGPFESCHARDAALVALHVASSLKPKEIRALSWPDVMSLSDVESAERYVVWSVESLRGHRGRPRYAAFHPLALDALGGYWRAAARPRGRPLFTRQRGRPVRLSDAHASDIVRDSARRAGLAGIDSRRLRDPFGRLLSICGVDDSKLRELLGLQRVGDVTVILAKQEELVTQQRARELLEIPGAHARAAEPTVLRARPSMEGASDR